MDKNKRQQQSKTTAGIFELYMMKNPNEPFSRKLVEVFNDPDILIKKYGWTKQEVAAGISGEVVRDRFMVELTPRFERDLAIEEILKGCGHDSFNTAEIADILNVDHTTIEVTLHHAYKKMGRDRLYKFLHLMREQREIKGRELVEIENKIHIEFD